MLHADVAIVVSDTKLSVVHVHTWERIASQS